MGGANSACVLFMGVCAGWSFYEGYVQVSDGLAVSNSSRRSVIAAGILAILLFASAKALNDNDGLGFADFLNRWRAGASMGLDAITSPK